MTTVDVLVAVDASRCCGYAACVELGPELFRLRDDDGLAEVVDGASLDPADPRIAEAITNCPTQAISRRADG